MKTKILLLLILLSAVVYLLYIHLYAVALGLLIGSLAAYFVITVLKSPKPDTKQIGGYNGWPLVILITLITGCKQNVIVDSKEAYKPAKHYTLIIDSLVECCPHSVLDILENRELKPYIETNRFEDVKNGTGIDTQYIHFGEEIDARHEPCKILYKVGDKYYKYHVSL